MRDILRRTAGAGPHFFRLISDNLRRTTYKYMMQSSDSRSFPIRPRIYIPKYDEYNKIHRGIVRLSKQAHEVYNNTEKMKVIVQEINDLYKYLLEGK